MRILKAELLHSRPHSVRASIRLYSALAAPSNNWLKFIGMRRLRVRATTTECMLQLQRVFSIKLVLTHAKLLQGGSSARTGSYLRGPLVELDACDLGFNGRLNDWRLRGMGELRLRLEALNLSPQSEYGLLLIKSLLEVLSIFSSQFIQRLRQHHYLSVLSFNHLHKLFRIESFAMSFIMSTQINFNCLWRWFLHFHDLFTQLPIVLL